VGIGRLSPDGPYARAARHSHQYLVGPERLLGGFIISRDMGKFVLCRRYGLRPPFSRDRPPIPPIKVAFSPSRLSTVQTREKPPGGGSNVHMDRQACKHILILRSVSMRPIIKVSAWTGTDLMMRYRSGPRIKGTQSQP